VLPTQTLAAAATSSKTQQRIPQRSMLSFICLSREQVCTKATKEKVIDCGKQEKGKQEEEEEVAVEEKHQSVC